MLYADCKRYGKLPYDGGVLDQDARLMRLMNRCADAAILSKDINIKKPAHRDFYRWLFPKDD